jgi:hypothetical protein
MVESIMNLQKPCYIASSISFIIFINLQVAHPKFPSISIVKQEEECRREEKQR